MRKSHVPSCALACSQLPRAVASDPACRGPVGEGAKRPRYCDFGLISLVDDICLDRANGEHSFLGESDSFY